MRPDHAADQAEGLRHLLPPAPPRAIAVTGAQAGLGATSVAINLAAALAHGGHNVLLLDENPPHRNAASMLALDPHRDLLDSVRCGKTWRDIVLHARQGVDILPAARALRALPQLQAAEREIMLDCLADASRAADIVLLDTSPRPAAGPASAALAPVRTPLLVLDTTPAAITESYAMMKRMAAREGKTEFMVTINRARDEAEARTASGNLEWAARHYLRVSVKCLGFIPVDEQLGLATQLHCPVAEIYPAAPSARAFERMGRAAIELPGDGCVEEPGQHDAVLRLTGRCRPPDIALVA